MNAERIAIDNMIMQGLSGSRAYGTSIPTSDTDIRGLFVAPQEYTRSPFFTIEQWLGVDGEDRVLFELNKFMPLLVNQNPNIIELLWVDDDDISFRTPAYDLLRSHRDELLSAKAKHTFSGYGYAQLKRIKSHNKWINNPKSIDPPKQIDFIKLVHNFTDAKMFKIDLRDYHTDYRLIPFDSNLYGLYPVDGYETFDYEFTLNTNYDAQEDFFTMKYVPRWIDRFLVDDRPIRRQPLFVIKFNADQYHRELDNWTNYWNWKKNRNKKRSVLEEEFGYDCYSDDTEFLTDLGWMKYDDISSNTKLATFDKETFDLQYQHYEDRYDGIANCAMRSITGTHMDIKVTPNHRMFVRHKERRSGKVGDWGFTQAALLPDSFEVLRHITPKQTVYECPSIDSNIGISIDNYLRLMGWFLSDGTFTFYNNHPKSIRISQKKGGRLHWHMSRFMNTYGHTSISLYSYDRTTSYSDVVLTEMVLDIRDKALVNKLYNDCGHSTDKHIPRWVFSLSKRKKEILFDAMVNGDGTIRKHKTVTDSIIYYTNNTQMSNDVHELALLCGWETSLYSYEDMYQIHVRKEVDQFKTLIRSRNCATLTKDHNRVVCFVVKNDTLITRRNGHVAFHGNTKHAMHLIRLMRMGVEILEDGVVNVKRADAKDLLDIRNGLYTYDEIVAMSDYYESEMESLYKTTSLRHSVDIKFASKLLLEVQDIAWGS